MNSGSTCSRKESRNGQPARPGKIIEFVNPPFFFKLNPTPLSVWVCMCVFFQPAHQISITRSWCYEDGILCCDGEVTNVVSFDLPSQFIDAILPTDEQLSNNGNPDLFSSDIPLDDGSVQYSLLEGGGTVGDGLFASNEFVPSGDVVYPDQNQDDLVAAGGIIGGDASWFQS